MIQEEYVNEEIMNLLLEKDYWQDCDAYYTHYVPTQSQVMKWLREVHNIFISIDIYSKDLEGNIRYCVDIYKYGSRMILDTPIICNTYEESSDLAIKYCLENLI